MVSKYLFYPREELLELFTSRIRFAEDSREVAGIFGGTGRKSFSAFSIRASIESIMEISKI